MEGGRADVTAFQLAAELVAGSSPPPSTASHRTPTNASSSPEAAAEHQRRGPRSQVDRLLDDQRRFSHYDGPVARAATTAATSSTVRPVPDDIYGRDDDDEDDKSAPASSPSPSVSARGKRKGNATGEGGASSVTSALQDAVMHWGKMKHGPDGAYAHAENSHGATSASSPSRGHLRYTWRLVEAERLPIHAGAPSSSPSPSPPPPPTPSSCPSAWSLGRRWERSDDAVHTAALLNAVRRETQQQTNTADTAEEFYASGLRLCALSSRSAVSLPAALSAVSTSTLAFFSFTEAEYAALTLPPPPPVAPSVLTFTYSSSCRLVELWGRFGNAVVVVDRWAYEEASKKSSSSPSTPVFALATQRHQRESAPVHPCTSETAEATFVPTVEQACAEYSRVTTGVLRQRQQRLLRAVLTQQQQQQQQQQELGEHAGQTSGPRPLQRHSNNVAPPAAVDTTPHAHTPFVSSFDRYALLHCAAPSEAEAAAEEEKKSPETMTRLHGEPSSSSPRTSPPTAAAAVVVDVTSERPAAAAAVPLTPQQRLTQCTTPNPWYVYAEEQQRRAALAELLRCERATNVPYQHAASRYLALATTAAQALQRAAFIFDDRDREQQRQEEEAEDDTQPLGGDGPHSAPRNAACVLSATPLGAPQQSSEMSPIKPCRVPPRSAFTVQLRRLPNVDPAVWRAAEATLRKAAVEVLGDAAAAAAASTTSSSKLSLPSRAQRGRKGKRSRSPVKGTSQKATKAAKTTGSESAAAVTALTKRGRGARKVKEEEEEEEVNGVLGEGSVESSVASDDGSDDSDDEEASDSSSASSDDEDEDDESVDTQSNDSDTTTHLSQDNQTARGRGAAARLPGRTSALSSRTASSPPPQALSSHLASDPTYRALQAYITDVIPFRCTRLRVAAQAGWLLPPPPALPHSLTDTLDENAVVFVDVGAAMEREASSSSSQRASADATVVVVDEQAGAASTPPHGDGEDAPYRPLLSEEDYQALRTVSTSAVCNRVVSHTGEAVLLTLPPTVPRLYREVEQELERYLYDDTSAMMEVNATAQSLMAQIRTAYTQNTYLLRYTARLEHVVDSLRKVEQECREVERAGADAAPS